jgi:3,4-dihydroxy 2-butanone 4-phosphate synthase/GTP cyclohydrolase II
MGGRVSGERSEDGQQRVLRRVGLGGQILSDLGIRRITLLSNHPTHVPALQGFGIEIVGQMPIPGVTEPENLKPLSY